MAKRKQTVQLTNLTRLMDGLVFAGYATLVAFIVGLLGYAIMANLT